MGKASDTLHQQIPIILTNTNSKSLCAGKMTVIGKKKTIKKIRKTLEKGYETYIDSCYCGKRVRS